MELNILTRTSDREITFTNLINSIVSQKNHSIKLNHIVSYDNESDLLYLKKYDNIKLVKLNKKDIETKYRNLGYYIDMSNINCYLHNLYCNELMDSVESGWVMFIDDDDFLYNDNVFDLIQQTIESSDVDEDTLIIFQMKMPGGRTVPDSVHYSKQHIEKGNIGSPCFIFNKKWISDDLRWLSWRMGDFDFIDRLSRKIPKQKWVQKIIVELSSIGFDKRHGLI